MNLGTLRIVGLEEIEFSLMDRIREEQGDLPMMVKSLRENGLMNPLTVYSPNLSPPYKLIAGGRRIQAAKILKWDKISVRIYDEELTEKQLRRLELYENLHRKDLTHEEELKITKDFHDMNVAIEGPKISKAPGAPGHSIRDTAKLLGKSAAQTAADIKLAEAVEKFPEVFAGLKNKSTAMKVMQRLSKTVKNRDLASKLPQVIKETTSLGRKMLESYKNEDFLLNTLPDASFNFVEADPPYGISIGDLRESEYKAELKGEYREIPEEEYEKFLFDFLTQCYRLCSENSWIILWFAFHKYDMCYRMMNKVGFTVNHNPGIWKKGNSPGQSMQADSNLGNACEFFLYGKKGTPKLRIPGRSNVFDFPVTPHQLKIHRMERPRDMIREILNTFCFKDDHVLVPFAGSGVTMMEATLLGMDSVGFDVSREFHDAYINRVVTSYNTKEEPDGQRKLLVENSEIPPDDGEAEEEEEIEEEEELEYEEDEDEC